MNIPALVHNIIFYAFAAILLISAVMVITSNNPVRAVLFLVLAFVSSSVLWILIEAEFLALVMIFVYVGAVMTLFLFVVMMINVDLSKLKEGFVRYLPLGILTMVVLVVLMMYVISPSHFGIIKNVIPVDHLADYSNTKELGAVLYTRYVYAFEIASVLLLVSIIAAISLAFRGRRADSKSQKIAEQIAVRPKDRVTLVDLKSSEKS